MSSSVHVPLMDEEQVHSTPLNDLTYEAFRKRIANSAFAYLDMRQSRAEGNFSMLHLSKNGKFTGCKFPSNVRVYGRNTTVDDDIFFVECRTFSNSKPSSIAAIFIGSNNKGFRRQKIGLYTNPHLVLIQDIIYENNRFHLCFHSLRENIDLRNSFQKKEEEELDTRQLKIPRKELNKRPKHREYIQDGKKISINIWKDAGIHKLSKGNGVDKESFNLVNSIFKLEKVERVPVDNVEVFHLNGIFGIGNHIIANNAENQMKNLDTLGLNGLKKPSTWMNQYSPSFKVFVEKRTTLRVGESLLRNSKEEIIKKEDVQNKDHNSIQMYEKSNLSKDTTHYICKPFAWPPNVELLAIPFMSRDWEEDEFVRFAFITKRQLSKLRKDFKSNGIPMIEYNKQLKQLHQETANQFQINWPKDLKYRKMSCKKENRMTVSVTKNMSTTSFETVIEKRVQKIRSDDSKGDFSIANGCVVFRGYVWPYQMTDKMKIAEKAIEICYSGCQTGRHFPVYGMFKHHGNRKSNQSNASGLEQEGSQCKHEYYEQNITSALAPICRSYISRLHTQAVEAGSHCGEVFMPQFLNISHENHMTNVLDMMLVTTQKFFNGFHVDGDQMTTAVYKEFKKHLLSLSDEETKE